MHNKKLISYLVWTFALGWALQIAASLLYRHGSLMGYQLLLMVAMFAPLAATVISKVGLKRLGWRPQLKCNVKYILAAWLLPAVLGAAGAALYFLIFPHAFDAGLGYVATVAGTDAFNQLTSELAAQGIPLPLFGVLAAVSAVTVAPFINMLLALGEETGWRGVLYPELKIRFGALKGRLLGGIIWGSWHWPLIVLAGYQYGQGYWGAPITGMLCMCIFTVAAGVFLDWLYIKSNTIWLPALGHGAINAVASATILFLNPAYMHLLLLGPVMSGLLSGLPLIVTAAILSVKLGQQARWQAR